jgi:hypothetical protein
MSIILWPFFDFYLYTGVMHSSYLILKRSVYLTICTNDN